MAPFNFTSDLTPVRVEMFEMFRLVPNGSQKSVIFLAIAALMAVVIACSSSPAPTATPEPTPTPVPTATPVPIVAIETDWQSNPIEFLNSIPSDEAECAANALGGRDRVIAMLELNLGSDRLTDAEAAALDACLSDETVLAVFIGQLSRDAGFLSGDTIGCIRERVTGMSAAGLFLEEPAADSIISSLQGIFCLNDEERAIISTSESVYGFGELGGIDAIECVVNGVGPTGLGELMGVASADALDFAMIGDLFPLMIDCGAVNDDQFAELGVSADQVGCVLSELGEEGLALLDPTAAEPDFEQLGNFLLVLNKCEITLDGMMGDSILPVDPADAMTDPPDLPTVELEIPTEIEEVDLPFSEEQLACLATEIGEDEIENLLAGGTPDFSLFTALATCEVDLSTLLGP